MITVNNYIDKASSINWNKLPKALQDTKEDIDFSIELYDDLDKGSKEVIDLFLKQLNKNLSKTEAKKSAVPPIEDARKQTPENGAILMQQTINGTTIALIQKGTKVQFVIDGKGKDIGEASAMTKKYKDHKKLLQNNAKETKKPAKKYNYKGLKVQVREVKKGNKPYYIVWDIKTDQQFSNDVFKTANSAVKFVEDNKMVLVKPKPTKKKQATKKESPCDDAIKNFLEDQKEDREKAAAKRKRNKVKNALDKETLNFYDADFRLLRRFYNLVSKKTKVSFRSVQLLYMAFQKHVVARKVRKTSDLANLFSICNKKLTKLYEAIAPEKQDAKITFADKDVLEQLATLVKNKKVDYSISLINRIINVQGTAPEDAKVQRLITTIDNAIKKGKIDERSRLFDDIKKGKSTLKAYLEDKTEKIPTKQYGLSGPKKKTKNTTKPLAQPQFIEVDLSQAQPINSMQTAPAQSLEAVKPTTSVTTKKEDVKTDAALPNKPLGNPQAGKKTKGVLSSQDIMNMSFESLEFQGEWKDFMQEPAKNMRLAVWGKPKNGKTAGATKLAAMLTQYGNVLYNFADQGVNKSTKDLWALSGLDKKPNAFLTDTRDIKELDKLCASGNYDFVFIDMINTYIDRTGIKHHEFEDQFLKKYPNISFIIIFEVTKSGNFKGDQGWTHLPDALITVENFVMHNQGRYGVGEYVVWKEGLRKTNPKKYKEFFDEEETTTQLPTNLEVSLS